MVTSDGKLEQVRTSALFAGTWKAGQLVASVQGVQRVAVTRGYNRTTQCRVMLVTAGIDLQSYGCFNDMFVQPRMDAKGFAKGDRITSLSAFFVGGGSQLHALAIVESGDSLTTHLFVEVVGSMQVQNFAPMGSAVSVQQGLALVLSPHRLAQVDFLGRAVPRTTVLLTTADESAPFNTVAVGSLASNAVVYALSGTANVRSLLQFVRGNYIEPPERMAPTFLGRVRAHRVVQSVVLLSTERVLARVDADTGKIELVDQGTQRHTAVSTRGDTVYWAASDVERPGAFVVVSLSPNASTPAVYWRLPDVRHDFALAGLHMRAKSGGFALFYNRTDVRQVWLQAFGGDRVESCVVANGGLPLGAGDHDDEWLALGKVHFSDSGAVSYSVLRVTNGTSLVVDVAAAFDGERWSTCPDGSALRKIGGKAVVVKQELWGLEEGGALWYVDAKSGRLMRDNVTQQALDVGAHATHLNVMSDGTIQWYDEVNSTVWAGGGAQSAKRLATPNATEGRFCSLRYVYEDVAMEAMLTDNGVLSERALELQVEVPPTGLLADTDATALLPTQFGSGFFWYRPRTREIMLYENGSLSMVSRLAVGERVVDATVVGSDVMAVMLISPSVGGGSKLRSMWGGKGDVPLAFDNGVSVNHVAGPDVYVFALANGTFLACWRSASTCELRPVGTAGDDIARVRSMSGQGTAIVELKNGTTAAYTYTIDPVQMSTAPAPRKVAAFVPDDTLAYVDNQAIVRPSVLHRLGVDLPHWVVAPPANRTTQLLAYLPRASASPTPKPTSTPRPPTPKPTHSSTTTTSTTSTPTTSTTAAVQQRPSSSGTSGTSPWVTVAIVSVCVLLASLGLKGYLFYKRRREEKRILKYEALVNEGDDFDYS